MLKAGDLQEFHLRKVHLRLCKGLILTPRDASTAGGCWWGLWAAKTAWMKEDLCWPYTLWGFVSPSTEVRRLLHLKCDSDTSYLTKPYEIAVDLLTSPAWQACLATHPTPTPSPPLPTIPNSSENEYWYYFGCVIWRWVIRVESSLAWLWGET